MDAKDIKLGDIVKINDGTFDFSVYDGDGTGIVADISTAETIGIVGVRIRDKTGKGIYGGVAYFTTNILERFSDVDKETSEQIDYIRRKYGG